MEQTLELYDKSVEEVEAHGKLINIRNEAFDKTVTTIFKFDPERPTLSPLLMATSAPTISLSNGRRWAIRYH